MDLLETDIEKCPINHLGQNNDHVLNRLTLEQARPVKQTPADIDIIVFIDNEESIYRASIKTVR